MRGAQQRQVVLTASLHIDAKMHFPGRPEMIAHHWCKAVAGGLVECQLYDSDNADARLVGVEVVVPSATFKSLVAAEKAMWHYHKTEIPKVSATLPDLSPAEAAKVAKSLRRPMARSTCCGIRAARHSRSGGRA